MVKAVGYDTRKMYREKCRVLYSRYGTLSVPYGKLLLVAICSNKCVDRKSSEGKNSCEQSDKLQNTRGSSITHGSKELNQCWI
jgi:hypothetical protein